MKKIMLIVILVVLFFLFIKNNTKNNLQIPTPTITPDENQFDNFTDSVGDYNYYYFKADPIEVNLIANFSERKKSNDVYREYGCLNLVNATFYTKEEKPIGLFKVDDKLLRDYRDNQTFNGVFAIDQSDNFSFSRKIKNLDEYRIALQSGPLLIENKNINNLKLKNDENARRVVLANVDQTLYFLIIYNKNSLYLGPTLQELPNILNQISNKLDVNFDNAINLDGGSASSIATSNFSLTELTYSGSFFCIK